MHTTDSILKKFIGVKTLPHVSIRLTQLISNKNSTIMDLEEIIKLDPTLVMRLLKLINSPYYGIRQKVENISRALVYLGMESLRNMVVVDAIKDIFKSTHDGEVFSRKKLWFHCAVVSICCQMIAERIFGQKGEDAFLCGILHDIGMIVEDQIVHSLLIKTCKAYEPKTKPISEYENDIIGTNHCELGYQLVSDWKVPEEVLKGIKNHHKVKKSIVPSSISGIVQIAEFMVTKLNYTAITGMTAFISPPLVIHIRENIDAYKTLVNNLPEEISKAKEIYQFDEE